jgi:hypothetical protein
LDGQRGGKPFSGCLNAPAKRRADKLPPAVSGKRIRTDGTAQKHSGSPKAA